MLTRDTRGLDLMARSLDVCPPCGCIVYGISRKRKREREKVSNQSLNETRHDVLFMFRSFCSIFVRVA